MSLIDRYVLKEWLIAFALTLGVIICILILQNMYDSLPDLLQTDAGFKQIVLYYSLTLPTYLPAILPISRKLFVSRSMSIRSRAVFFPIEC